MREHGWGRNDILDHAAGACRHAPNIAADRAASGGVRVTRRSMAVCLALVVQLSTACAGASHSTQFGGSPAGAWPEVLAATRRAESDGKFDAADTALAEFAAHHPGTIQALETAYWRALLKMDPANPHASLSAAMASLDAYLTDSRPREHGAEAATLRRLASQVDGLNKLAASTISVSHPVADAGGASQARPQPVVADASPDAAEIKRLKDELAKVNAELDRIRKRLAQPPPGKP